jgi:hypothetical protein
MSYTTNEIKDITRNASLTIFMCNDISLLLVATTNEKSCQQSFLKISVKVAYYGESERRYSLFYIVNILNSNSNDIAAEIFACHVLK